MGNQTCFFFFDFVLPTLPLCYSSHRYNNKLDSHRTDSSMFTAEKSKIQPFEWLTSPESIGRFVREYVLDGEGHASNDACERKEPTAMHIGCGSSTVGEYLVQKFGFAKVVNVDRDREILEGMAERWSEMINTESSRNAEEKKDESVDRKGSLLLTPENCSADNSQIDNSMEFWCLDYTSQTLPERYSDLFDLVVDKSTLDCTLCSDCSATAAFLSEIYRTLSSNHGTYLVISFHELDLILPLLRDLPGAHWEISHTTMERQVENLNANKNSYATENSTPLPTETDSDSDTATIPSNRKPLNVLIARKLPICETEIRVDSSHLHRKLVFEDVVKHVQEVNDRWFQDEQPLLTDDRIADLKAAFFGNDSHSKHMSLQDAYGAMFTEAEREHLTYEHFLEDWEAFCQEEKEDKSPTLDDQNTSIVTYDLALSFLRANQ